ncbi:MAG: DUF3800 domain-containing protein [Meiothermus sp.]|nr:DUF3800 domain-containing protein [Meiothermus sp.]
MYIIYLDEFGDSSNRLDEASHPLFALAAALVPANTNWLQLEGELIEISLEIKRNLALPETHRLHMVDLYQRTGPYKNRMSVEQSFGWIEKILQAAQNANVLYHVRYMDRAKHKRNLLEGTTGQREAAERGEATQTMYLGQFPQVLYDLDLFLREQNSYAMLIADQHKDFEHFAALDTYRAWRVAGLLEKILEAPFYRDSRRHTLLTLPDFAAYTAAGFLLNTTRDKPRPMLDEWHQKYIRPCLIKWSEPTLSLERMLFTANFYITEGVKQPDLEAVIKSAQAVKLK